MPSALGRCAPEGDAVTRARECVQRAEAYARRGRHASAERLLREATAAFARRDALHAAADVGIALGRLLGDRGRVTAAERVLRDATELAEASGDPRRRRDARLWRALAALEAGHASEAYALAYDVAHEASAGAHRTWARAIGARVLLAREPESSPDPQELVLDDGDAAVLGPDAAAVVDAAAVACTVAAGNLFEAGLRARVAVDRAPGGSLPSRVLSRTAHFTVVAETGDLVLIAEQFAALERLMREGHLPLPLVRARLVWLEALRRGGAAREAARQARRLMRLRAAATPLLLAEIDRRLARGRDQPDTPASRRATVDAGVPLAALVPELVGVSPALEDVRGAVVRAARAPFAVLIEGESGVGKELVARAIHRLGPRAERRFVDLNCAALADDLLDAELFGHARGAFTGAVADRPGLFEDASGGTLFLDEVADLSPRAQARLLRVIQQQEVRRVGETRPRAIDVRLIAAANRDMRQEAAGGRFRHDLLYRLDVIRIRVPPLRERPADIELLARHFWRASCERIGSCSVLGADTLAALARYAWPGNVRELQNVMAALAVAGPARGTVEPALLPGAVRDGTSERAVTLADARTDAERRCIERALALTGGNRARAALALGVSRQGLLKAMERLGVTGRGG